MMQQDLDDIFFLPLSTQAFEELLILHNLLDSTEYDDGISDLWTPVWGNKYTSRCFYSHAFSNVEAHPIFKAMWKCSCIPRIKFFAWLVLVDRLNTKTMLRRRHINIQDDPLCVLCNTGAEEDIDHLFFDGPFATQCWNQINVNWDTSLPMLECVAEARTAHNLTFFIEASLIAAWELWKVRNDKVF